ncbi:uncharacterized protein SEPMUDRAFT_151230 [Sphaerulina musiva SO2202]|uniref:Uncharacterized protein n=1 Tax=Sphaerulina musiva (strain SO2202) TaxID=692275 RepID=M3CCU7_SPHMS|nr:uncharacterized protein SEPMUDRAFT_151230 [Sphaerulina musiva SO2202]EMF10237.1 hypothetical protein SEPMUDRAFT_151230 [Sphaerulina musiva SO2202]
MQSPLFIVAFIGILMCRYIYVHAQTDDGSDDNSWLDYGSFCQCITLHAHDHFHPQDNVTAKVCNDINGTTNDWPADKNSISFLKHCDFDFDDAEAAVTTFAESCRTADQEYFHLNVTGAQCCPKGDGACQGDNTPPPEEIPPPTNKTEKRQDEDYFVDKTAFCQCSQAFPNETFYAVKVNTYEVCDWYNQTGGAIDVPKYTTESEGTIAHCQFPDAEKSIDQFSQDCRNVDKYLFQGVTGAQCCPKGDGACVANNTGIDDTTSTPMKKYMFL